MRRNLTLMIILLVVTLGSSMELKSQNKLY